MKYSGCLSFERKEHIISDVSIDPDVNKRWFKRLYPLIREQRTSFLITSFCGIVGLTIQVSVPMVIREAIDNPLTDGSGEISSYAWTLIVMAACAFLLRYTYRFLLFRTAYRIETQLRSLIYRHLTKLSFSFFDRIASGEVISRANSDIRSIQLLLAFGPLAMLSILSFLLALIFMLSIHLPLTLVTVSCMPFVYVLAQKMRDKVFPLSWVTQGRMADLAMVVDENINGSRIVKSFAAERKQIELLAEKAQRLRWSSTALIDSRARFNPLIESLPRLGMASILMYGGWLAINEKISIGALIAFSSYVIMISVPFRMLGFVLLQVQRAAASSLRIFEILDEKPAIENKLTASKITSPLGNLSFRNVSFSYPNGENLLVLENFSLEIAAGETVALVGRTGCGKSTVARLLPRFYDVTDGSILLDGTDIRDFLVEDLRTHINVIPDEPFLFSESVRNNIAFARPDAQEEEVVAAAEAAQAADFISDLTYGYEEIVGERGYTLSGGQRQRIVIARTLLANPKILVLDDSTSSIDVETESLIHTSLKKLLQGRTTLVIAHRLSTIALADRVVLMDSGKVKAEGTHEYLLANSPEYESILASGAMSGAE
ncbi:MAG: ABC transporter ATP-binding protein [Acidimicrobiales bacterium]|jgi:ATP-binding cassette subfamily B protein|nr:ABC transporter ATP-binding protein [Acidimicrobiaceae bacterium]MDP6162609.1 ABC transporter ATP-binding protein [Acidimicrobiales bacterium]MDP6285591.1 ABC transporter ATP-binding protein [Acidimicrobiales bacterium]HJO40679.1 ABC transporter ATP-binding protein [Acidimicrobiales bacterium]|tara:strand:+ start:836 stop:2644 length:1809 start_codon:yes stop_codon:yes gene_type:complete